MMNLNVFGDYKRFSPLNRINTSLATKLTVGIVLAILIPLVVASFIADILSANQLRDQVGSSVVDVAEVTADQVAQTFIENIRLLETVADIEPLYRTVEATNAAYESTDEEIQSQILALEEAWQAVPDDETSAAIEEIISDDDDINFIAYQLRDFQETFPDHVELFVTDRYGALIGATNRTSDYYQADEAWWQATWNDGLGDFYIGDPELDESAGLVGFIIAIPIKDSNDRVIGILRSTLNIEVITEIVAERSFANSGHIAIFDRDGVTVFNAANPESLGSDMPEGMLEAEVIRATRPGWIRTSSLTGEDAFIGYAKATRTKGIEAIDRLNWTVGAILSADEALAPIATTIRAQLIFGTIAAIVTIVLVSIVVRRSTEQISHISNLFSEINAANYEARTEVVSEDEMGQMAQDLNTMLDNTLILVQSQEERDRLQNSIVKLLDEVSGVAAGNLTVEAEVTTEATGAIADAFNYMIDQLRQIISGVQNTSHRVTASAQVLQTVTEQLAQGVEEQASQIIDASAEISQMADSMQGVSESAAQSVFVAQDATNIAQRGSQAVQDTIRGMNRIRGQVSETARRITRLGQSSQEIGEIVQVINDIADRTSILALNAAIQAAAAGEAGQGFAVVANEVEGLANQATQATQQVTSLIKTVQTEINEAVNAMEESSREVEAGAGLADQAGQTLTEIEEVSNRLAELIRTISLSAQQRAEETVSVAQSMGLIAKVTQQTADSTRSAALSINDLSEMASELRNSVSTFQLPNTNGRVV